jgi:hypothetical protein
MPQPARAQAAVASYAATPAPARLPPVLKALFWVRLCKRLAELLERSSSFEA